MYNYVSSGIEGSCSQDNANMAENIARRAMCMARVLGKEEDVRQRFENDVHSLVELKAYSPARGIAKALNLKIDIPDENDEAPSQSGGESSEEGGTVSLS